MRTVVKVGEHYQMTIPEDIREKLGIKPGDELLVSERDGLLDELSRRGGEFFGGPGGT